MKVYRAGDTVEDVCRACKLDRLHTVIAADDRGVPVRVQCDYCSSQHHYRGGPADRPRSVAGDTPTRHALAPAGPPTTARPFDLVSPRERVAESIEMPPPPSAPDVQANPFDLETLLRRIIREEAGVTPAVPAERWRGGTLVLKPGNPALQEKSWPIETLFHKIVMIRNRLRTLEQQINASELPDDVKLKLQAYVTGCYGSLTSFNVLFAREEDQFKGASSD